MPEYVWFIIGGVILVLAVIGFVADKSSKKNPGEPKPKKDKKEKKAKVMPVEPVVPPVATNTTLQNNTSFETATPMEPLVPPVESTVKAPETPMDITPTAFQETSVPTDLSAPLVAGAPSSNGGLSADIFTPMSGTTPIQQPANFGEVQPVAGMPDVDPTLFQPIGDTSSAMGQNQASFPEVSQPNQTNNI